MKILNGTNSILSVFLVFLSLIFNSCSSLTNLDKKNTNLVSGKFMLAMEEVYLNGFLEILKIDDVFLLKIETINSKNEYKIKFSEKKLVLSEKESEFLSNKIDFNLMDINFIPPVKKLKNCLYVMEIIFPFIQNLKTKVYFRRRTNFKIHFKINFIVNRF